MFKFSFQPEELNESICDGASRANSAINEEIVPQAEIHCAPYEEIFPSTEHVFKVPGSIAPKHGLMIFAGGQEVIHLKSDVLIKDLVEGQIQKRLEADRIAAGESGAASDSHTTDLIPGVYEGNNDKRSLRGLSNARPKTRFSGDSVRHSHIGNTFWRNRPNSSHGSGGGISSHQHIRSHANAHFIPDRQKGHHVVDSMVRQQRRGCGPKSKKRNKQLNDQRHPWFNKEMADLIKMREKAHKKWLAGKDRAKGDANWEVFKKIRNQVSTLRHSTRNNFLVAAMKVDGFSSVQPWPTKGGGKIWECTQDLGDYMTESCDKALNRFDLTNKYVMDLGCGAGILGLLALQAGAIVHFQDYNREILSKVTMQNVALNCTDGSKQRILDRCRFFAGDWANYVAVDGPKFDIILTCETIYNPANNQKILDVLKKKLRPLTGVAYVAAKTYYFGVGGGLRAFEALVRSDDTLHSEVVWTTTENVQREILKIIHNNTDRTQQLRGRFVKNCVNCVQVHVAHTCCERAVSGKQVVRLVADICGAGTIDYQENGINIFPVARHLIPPDRVLQTVKKK